MMDQLSLNIPEEEDPAVKTDGAKSRRSGPPNRINDLNYSTWMKFQKSFFRYAGKERLIQENILFFTKAIYENSGPSNSLIISPEIIDSQIIESPRYVEWIRSSSITATILTLEGKVERNEKFDFAFIDLQQAIQNPQQLDVFIKNEASRFFSALRKILSGEKYCCVLLGWPNDSGAGFPVPWAVALSARDHLRLRDEKIGFVDNQNQLLYCLYMQSSDDKFESKLLTPASLVIAKSPVTIPAWVFPKPPPRTRKELLHPAKFPETLVGQFISLFTEPGDSVIDPMMGTGSAILSAVQLGRNAVGIDLSDEYVGLAADRLREGLSLRLFREYDESAKWEIFQGDSANLEKIKGIADRRFDYCITSPPYWSMLQNPGSEGQRNRKKKDLPLVYSDQPHDLGNIKDYEEFLKTLSNIYTQVAKHLIDGGYLTVIVKNVKREHIVYPLAWDITSALCGLNGPFSFVGNTLWFQDDIGLKPFAVGTHWVSNTHHQYCLHFKKRAANFLDN